MRRIEGERGPGEGAAAYERDLRGALGEGVPGFDLVLLGIGPDAHICSLFPNDADQEALAVRSDVVGQVCRRRKTQPTFVPGKARIE